MTSFGQKEPIHTQSIPDTVFLNDIIIEAYRADEKSPTTFKTIDKKTISIENTSQEPSEMLSYTPSINAYSDAGNFQGYSYFRLRGIDQTRINMTLDGIPLNETEDQGVYFSNYPDFFNSIESLQIQRGVGTSTNGVASYAGSINFQSPDLNNERNIQIGANYGSFNTYRLFGEMNSSLFNDQGIYVRVSHLHSDGYKHRSANTSNSGFFKYGILKPKHKLKLIAFIGNQKNELAWIAVPKPEINNDPRTNGNADENDEFTQSLISIQHAYTINKNLILNNTVYYNFLDGNYDFDLNNFLGLPSTEEMYNYDFRHHFAGYFNNLNWHYKNLKINLGTHINTFNRRHLGSERTLGELYRNKGFKNEFSSFLKARYDFQQFTFYGDLQYRYAEFDYEGAAILKKMSWNFINPRVGLGYNISQNSNLYYSFGSTGREPTRNDIFNGEDELPIDASGNGIYQDIRPEYVQNHEFGFKTIQKKWFLMANLYYMSFKNEIVLNGQYGPNGLPLHSNVAKSYRSGLEIDFKLDFFNNLYVQSNVSLSHNRIKENGIKFSPILTPEFISNNKLGFKKKKFHFGTELKYQNYSYIDFSNETKLPDFLLVNLFAHYSYKKIDIQLRLNNITNQTILSNGYIGIDGTPLYFVQAPFNLSGGITWSF